jgi:hypothetical protein
MSESMEIKVAINDTDPSGVEKNKYGYGAPVFSIPIGLNHECAKTYQKKLVNKIKKLH